MSISIVCNCVTVHYSIVALCTHSSTWNELKLIKLSYPFDTMLAQHFDCFYGKMSIKWNTFVRTSISRLLANHKSWSPLCVSMKVNTHAHWTWHTTVKLVIKETQNGTLGCELSIKYVRFMIECVAEPCSTIIELMVLNTSRVQRIRKIPRFTFL